MMNRYLKKTLKYYHTIKHLKLIQIYGQLIFRFKKPRIDQKESLPCRHQNSSWVRSILKLSTFQAPNKIILLNQERCINENIWNNARIDKLWLYHLHYFDVINSTEQILDWQSALIKQWIVANPPADGVGWDSYPLSLRIVNWIKWSLIGNELSNSMLHSLLTQIRYLAKRIEIHLLGNHLLANAKALIFGGLFFIGDEADFWFTKGLTLFKQELDEQVLKDGGHFEQSPMYHGIIFEDLLDVINLFKTYGHVVPKEWRDICEKMFFWLRNMCHLDQEISFFNDAAFSVAPLLRELQAYCCRLNLLVPNSFDEDIPRSFILYFPDSGYCRLQHHSMLLLADISNIAATYQPGHVHADSLSFELSIGMQRLIVNSGISSYAENETRLRQRGSKTHNTLVIDDLDSSEIWKSFRVARRARIKDIVIEELNNEFFLKATHDGYIRINNIYHTRMWRIKNNLLLIQDEVSGEGRHKIDLNFHIHPQVNIIQVNERRITFNNQLNQTIAMLEVDSHLKIIDSTFHPTFNSSIPNKKIIVSFEEYLPIRLTTSIEVIA